MLFNNLALLALASVAVASPNNHLAARQDAAQCSGATAQASILAILATALPQSLVSVGLTDPAKVGSEIASSFSAGNTPPWYEALPSGVKACLPVLYAEQTADSSSVASSTPAPASSSAAVTVVSTVVSLSATVSPSGNSTVVSTVHSPTLSKTSTVRGASSTGAAATTTSTGGASFPTAVMGAGIAGALGFLGMLAM